MGTLWEHVGTNKGEHMTKEQIKEKQNRLMETFCDKYCRKPDEIADDALLMLVCHKCPMEELLKLERGEYKCEEQEHQP